MTEEKSIHPFAIEHAADGLHYLHSERSLHPDGRGYASKRHPEGFATDAEARAYARKHHHAGAEQFAVDPNTA